MGDKLKRLNKILVKKGMKGQFKPVDNLEDAHIILIENKQCIDKTALMGKDTYKKRIEEGHTFPSDIVHFLVSANPRNGWNIERRFLTNATGLIRRTQKNKFFRKEKKILILYIFLLLG